MSGERVRVGVLTDELTLPAWQATMLRQIVGSDHADVVLVVRNAAPPFEARRSVFAKVFERRMGLVGPSLLRKALHLIYTRLIDRNTLLPDANDPVDCAELLGCAEQLEVTPDRTTYSDYLRHDDVEAIRERRVDVLIRLGFGILRGEILAAARVGVWSFHHGDNRVIRGGPPGFWESMEGWPVTGTVLQILNEDLDNGTVISRSFARTDPFSIRDSRSNALWKSPALMTRALERLYRVGPEAFLERLEQENRHPSLYSHRLYRSPTNRELVRLVSRKLRDKIALLRQGRGHFDQWVLLYHLSPELSSSLWRYRKIMPPKDRFWADPHVIQRDGRYWVFFEEYPFATARGHICVMEISEDGTWEEPRTVLERPYHLSYPFVFESGNELYMIPESMENRTIELYRCVRFPDRWEHVMNLMEGVSALDATVLERGGRWWLFTNLVTHPGASTDDELFLFSAERLLTQDWEPHPLNPIVSDCTRARPAGRLFTMNGRLYRPSQNCGVRYGYGFNFSEVTVLSREEYAEELVTRAEPDWDPEIVGTHTFSRVGNLHVIDAIHWRRR